MKVDLLYHTPLWVAAKAIRKCWASEDKSDTKAAMDEAIQNAILQDDYGYDAYDITGEKDKELIHRVGNKNKHSSTLEHLNYSFYIDGISRACLQELARHRHTSLSVKSTRYTLKELRDEEPWNGVLFNNVVGCFDQVQVDRAKKYIVLTGENFVDEGIIWNLETLRRGLSVGISNDIAKYSLPEAYKTSLVWTINARSLQNFLSLRTDKAALWEIRELAYEIYKQLPEEHKYLFAEFVKGETDG